MKAQFWLPMALGACVTILGAESCSSAEFTGCESTFTCPPESDGSAGLSGSGGSGASGGGIGASGASAGGTSASGSGGDAPAAGGSLGTAGAGAVGGSAGQAGAATAGEAGAPAPPECLQDADCDDKEPCNGAEKCSGQKCVAGTPPCVNADAVHCVVTCANNNGAAACSTKGVDKDNDMHTTTACAQAPGDDCNDANKDIHPGAAEICDGIDNDCNGKIDMADGLTPINPIEMIYAGLGGNDKLQTFPAIVWAPQPQAYMLVWAFKPAATADPNHIRFQIFNQARNIAKDVDTGAFAGTIQDIDVAHGANSYGFVWSSYASGSPTTWAVTFFEYSDVGAWVSPTHVPAPDSSMYGYAYAHVAYVASTGWIFSWLSELQTNANQANINARVLSSGQLSMTYPISPVGYPFGSDLAANSQVAFSLFDAKGLTRTIRSADLGTALNDFTVTSYSIQSAVAGNETGFGVAWSASDGLHFQNFTAAGTAGCTQVLASVTAAVDDIIPSGTGYLIAAGSTLVPVSNTCKFGAPVDIGLGDVKSRIAGTNTTGYMLVGATNAGGSGPTSFSLRRFGPLFCN